MPVADDQERKTQSFGRRRLVIDIASRHVYTRRLLDAVLRPDPSRRTAFVAIADGEVPSSIHAIGHSPARMLLTDVGGRHLVAQ